MFLFMHLPSDVFSNLFLIKAYRAYTILQSFFIGGPIMLLTFYPAFY